MNLLYKFNVSINNKNSYTTMSHYVPTVILTLIDRNCFSCYCRGQKIVIGFLSDILLYDFTKKIWGLVFILEIKENSKNKIQLKKSYWKYLFPFESYLILLKHYRNINYCIFVWNYNMQNSSWNISKSKSWGYIFICLFQKCT